MVMEYLRKKLRLKSCRFVYFILLLLVAALLLACLTIRRDCYCCCNMFLQKLTFYCPRRFLPSNIFDGCIDYGDEQKYSSPLAYGVFTEGMRLQHAFGVPNYRFKGNKEEGGGESDNERIWRFLHNYSQIVWDAARPANLSSFTFATSWEKKHMVGFAQPDVDCQIVSIGIGREVDVELQIKERYPQCRFLGVDPDGRENNHGFFDENAGGALGVGAKFVQAAVHAQSGVRRGIFLDEASENLMGYVEREMEHVGIEEFLQKHLLRNEEEGEKKMVDLLIIDIEGAEHTLLGWLAGSLHKPIICQMNVEFHYPGDKLFDSLALSYTAFFAGLRELLRTHALFNTGTNPHNHLLAHFVNVSDRDCLRKLGATSEINETL